MMWQLVPRGPIRGRVLCAHATGNDALYPLVRLYQTLVAASYEVFAFDLDGHGRRSSAVLARHSIESAVPGAISRILADRPPLPLHLLGQSLGGALCLKTLLDGEPRIASLTLIGTPAVVNLGLAPLLTELGIFVRPCFWREIGIYGPWGMVPALGSFKRGTFPVRLAAAASRPLDYAVLVKGIIADVGVAAARSQCQTPCLLLAGGLDGIASEGAVRQLQASFPHSRLTVVPRATHFSLPFEPEVIRQCLSFLESVEAKSLTG